MIEKTGPGTIWDDSHLPSQYLMWLQPQFSLQEQKLI